MSGGVAGEGRGDLPEGGEDEDSHRAARSAHASAAGAGAGHVGIRRHGEEQTAESARLLPTRPYPRGHRGPLQLSL